jgi:molecular chaperone DnaK (HSP70)
LNVKALINDLTAVSLDYGNRNFDNADLPVGATKKVLFYNVGAHGTVASLIEYTKTGAAGFKSKVLHALHLRGVMDVSHLPRAMLCCCLQVVGSAFDAEIGGLDFDIAVREHLIAEFDQVSLSRVRVSRLFGLVLI